MIMRIALNLNVEVKDGTLVLTDCAGKAVIFAKEQTVQKKVSMITLGELCGLPKRQLATGFGFKTRKSYYDSRNAVLQGVPADLLPKRPGPHHPSKRTQEVEALIIRTRFETDGNMYELADTITQMGFPVSARLVGQVLADYGLAKKNGCLLPPSQLGSWPKRRSKSSTGPASRAHVSSPGTTSSMTSPPCSNAGSRPPVRVAFSLSPTSSNWAPLTSSRL
jgi:hypothetical protein